MTVEMTRHYGARFLAGLTCLCFLGTAALHSTGYASVVRLAKDVPGVMGEVMPALWLVFSFDLVVVGLIVGVLAVRPADLARPVLIIAALCPFSAAVLQLRFIGFVPPTGLLIALGVLTWASAGVWPAPSRPSRTDTGSGEST